MELDYNYWFFYENSGHELGLLSWGLMIDSSSERMKPLLSTRFNLPFV